MEELKEEDPEKYQVQFARFVKAGVDSDDLEVRELIFLLLFFFFLLLSCFLVGVLSFLPLLLTTRTLIFFFSLSLYLFLA